MTNLALYSQLLIALPSVSHIYSTSIYGRPFVPGSVLGLGYTGEQDGHSLKSEGGIIKASSQLHWSDECCDLKHWGSQIKLR